MLGGQKLGNLGQNFSVWAVGIIETGSIDDGDAAFLVITVVLKNNLNRLAMGGLCFGQPI